jgi:hypothetical protein
MAEKGDLIPKNQPEPEPLPADVETVSIGEWYWIKGDGEEKEWFGCVTEVGSNYAEFGGVPNGSHESWNSTRVHFDKFSKVCRREPDPESVIRRNIGFYRGIVQEKLGEIKEITARLGITDHLKLEHRAPHEESSRALSVLSGTDNVKSYKKALIRAKEKDLPKLFEEVKEANSNLASWMSAQALPMRAMAEGMGSVVGEIEDRIFNVSLYAGLTEEVTQVTKGDPAGQGEKLHIFQRLLFMDEECLLDYKHGGMEFKHIGAFDKWLAKPENLNRALPCPRSLVAFRVRKDRKERDWEGSIQQILINFEKEQLDKATFLYIRNGERLYRLNCDLEFGDLIFPGREELNLSEPMMAKVEARSIESFPGGSTTSFSGSARNRRRKLRSGRRPTRRKTRSLTLTANGPLTSTSPLTSRASTTMTSKGRSKTA